MPLSLSPRMNQEDGEKEQLESSQPLLVFFAVFLVHAGEKEMYPVNSYGGRYRRHCLDISAGSTTGTAECE